MPHETFHYHTLEQLREAVEALHAPIAFSENTEILKRPVEIAGRRAANALAVLPMEGCDSKPNGGVSELVRRRYRRFAQGGSGLIWWEACAVAAEGRANPLQMMLTQENQEDFARLTEEVRRESEQKNQTAPIQILQLTHSGRYARPKEGGAQPMIPQRDPILDAAQALPESYPVVTDDYLDSLIENYVQSARLAKACGFDGVDIKACHRYLISELLASRTREGKYGGSFENRSRFLLEVVRAVKSEVGDSFIVACRFSAFDRHPYPYGFGTNEDDPEQWEPAEPIALTKELIRAGANLLSSSAGNPYYINPEVTRPFDHPVDGAPVPAEHPLTSVARLFSITRKIQEAAKEIPVVGTGYSWLRQFIPYAAAANVESGGCSIVGLGRSSIAYPNAPRDILQTGTMDSKKCCVACSKCTQIMRNHGKAGCVVRDTSCYGPEYKASCAAAIKKSKGE